MKKWDKIIYKDFKYLEEKIWIYAHCKDWKHYMVCPADEENFLKGKNYQSWIVWYSYKLKSW